MSTTYLDPAATLALVAGRTFVPMTDADYQSFAGASDGALISYGEGDDEPIMIVDGTLVSVIHDAPMSDSQTFELAVQS